MNTLLVILLVLAMGATVYVLVRGVIAMASGKDVTGEQQQKWMRKRVMFQALAIIIVVAILALAAPPAADAWSGSTRSTRAPATTAKPGSPTARASPRTAP